MTQHLIPVAQNYLYFDIFEKNIGQFFIKCRQFKVKICLFRPFLSPFSRVCVKWPYGIFERP